MPVKTVADCSTHSRHHQLCVSNIAKDMNIMMRWAMFFFTAVSSMSSALNFAMHCKRANLDENRKQFLWCAKCFQCYPGGVWLNIVRVFFSTNFSGTLGTRKNLFATFVPIEMELDKDCFMHPLIIPTST